MRHQHSGLTTQTENALQGIVKAVSDALDVTGQYLHAILGAAKHDPYKEFRWFARGIARARAERLDHYINDLRTIRDVELERQGRGASRPTGELPALHKELSGVITSALEDKPAAYQQQQIHEAIDCLTARLQQLEDRGGSVN